MDSKPEKSENKQKPPAYKRKNKQHQKHRSHIVDKHFASFGFVNAPSSSGAFRRNRPQLQEPQQADENIEQSEQNVEQSEKPSSIDVKKLRKERMADYMKAILSAAAQRGTATSSLSNRNWISEWDDSFDQNNQKEAEIQKKNKNYYFNNNNDGNTNKFDENENNTNIDFFTMDVSKFVNFLCSNPLKPEEEENEIENQPEIGLDVEEKPQNNLSVSKSEEKPKEIPIIIESESKPKEIPPVSIPKPKTSTDLDNLLDSLQKDAPTKPNITPIPVVATKANPTSNKNDDLDFLDELLDVPSSSSKQQPKNAPVPIPVVPKNEADKPKDSKKASKDLLDLLDDLL